MRDPSHRAKAAETDEENLRLFTEAYRQQTAKRLQAEGEFNDMVAARLERQEQEITRRIGNIIELEDDRE